MVVWVATAYIVAKPAATRAAAFVGTHTTAGTGVFAAPNVTTNKLLEVLGDVPVVNVT
jgi:hypothetical protein